MKEKALYYTIGELAYTIAKSDGGVQKKELESLKMMLDKHPLFKNKNMAVASIIFQVLHSHSFSWERAYQRAISDLKKHKHFLTQDLKKAIIDLLESVAKSYGGKTELEKDLIKGVQRELEKLLPNAVR